MTWIVSSASVTALFFLHSSQLIEGVIFIIVLIDLIGNFSRSKVKKLISTRVPPRK